MIHEKISFLGYCLMIVAYIILLIKTLNIIIGLIISISTIACGLIIWNYHSKKSSGNKEKNRTFYEHRKEIIWAVIVGFPIAIIVGIPITIMIEELNSDHDEVDGKVVFDETRLIKHPNGSYDGWTSENDWYGGWYFARTLKENGFSVSEISTAPINYEKLKKYDVLIMLSSSEDYSSSEIESIEKFVKNGGGLFLIVDSWGPDKDYPTNAVAKRFGVYFATNGFIYDDTDHKGKVRIFPTISDIKPHEITTGVLSFHLTASAYIKNTGSSNVLVYTGKDAWFDKFKSDEGEGVKEGDEASGPFPVLSEMSYGNGKIVFIGDNGIFLNGWIKDDSGNQQLGLNTVKWLATP